MKSKRSKATDIIQKEIWRPVKGYEVHYEISNLGNVLSKGNFKNCKGGFKPKRIIKPITHKQGYLVVRLYADGKQKNHFVHRLIVIAFIPNPLNKKFVNHKDGNKQNNAIDNLEWCTRSENNIHAYKNNLNKMCKRISVKNKSTNEITKHYSYAEASRYIRRNNAYVSARINANIYSNSEYEWGYNFE